MIDFSSDTGALFPRLGKLGGVISNIRSNQTLQLTAMTSQATGIVGQLNSESDIQALVGSAYIGVLASLAGSAGPLMQQVAIAIANRVVYRDNPRVTQTLTQSDSLASLQEIIRQMRLAQVTVLAQTVAATITDFGTPTGTLAVLNVSLKRPFDGLYLENAFAENINVYCTADSYIGGATEGNEQITWYGGGSIDDPFAFDWPGGSGAQLATNLINGEADNSEGNLLTNSGFDAWTDDVPDNWELVIGTAGTDILEDNGVTFGGTASARITGDSVGTLTQIRQLFNDSDGSISNLTALSQYSFCIWLQRDGIQSSQGTLEVSLVDENDVIIQDENGVQNVFTVDLTAIPTLFAPYKGVFRTPHIMPTSIYLRIRLSVALDDGRSIWMDKAGLGEMQQLYVSGPFLAGHSGSTPLELNDVAQAVISNSRGVAGTLDTWQSLWARLFFDLVYQNELLLPSDSNPLISDTLIS